MARPKKTDEQKQLAPATHAQNIPSPGVVPPAAAAPINHQNKVIDVENFIRVRNSVYQRLTTIQDLIRSFSDDYLRQTNLLIGEPALIENGADILPQNLQNLDMLQFQPIPTAMPVAAPPVEEKKERKKRQHDPNAPKRPLTPYFLYMQTARPIIAADLGDSVPKGAVQDEGQRRWSSMSAQEKLGWNQAYQYNLRLYNARVHSYKAGNVNAKEMTDEEAVRYCEEFNIPMPPVGGVDVDASDNAAIQQQLQQQHVPAPVPVEEPAGKTPKTKGSRKRKSEAAEPVQSTPASTAVAAASPDKKRKRASAKPVEQPEKDEPKKSGRKKAKSG